MRPTRDREIWSSFPGSPGFCAQVNPVAAGALTGGLFKAAAGPRGAALAAAIGGGLAAASHLAPGAMR